MVTVAFLVSFRLVWVGEDLYSGAATAAGFLAYLNLLVRRGIGPDSQLKLAVFAVDGSGAGLAGAQEWVLARGALARARLGAGAKRDASSGEVAERVDADGCHAGSGEDGLSKG